MRLGFSNGFINESASKLSSQMIKLFLIALEHGLIPSAALQSRYGLFLRLSK